MPTKQLRPRRTLNRLALALVAIAIAAVGQMALVQYSLWEGLLLYLMAAILFGRALVHQSYPNFKFYFPNPYLANSLTVTQGRQKTTGLGLIGVAVVISCLSYTYFGQLDHQHLAWWLYLTSLGLLVAGVLVLTPALPLRPQINQLFPNRQIIVGLMVVFGLALFMRLFNFTQQPFGIWFDEAEAGLAARHMLADPDYRPVFYQLINVTGHFLAVYAMALHWLGDSIYALRAVSVLFGLGGVLAAYLFGRELHGPRFGLALAFFVAVARWHVNFSRIAMTGIDTPFFEFLTLFFLTRLLKRGRLRDALWAGLTLGFGLTFYTAFRLFILALGLFAGITLLRWTAPVLKGMRQGGWQRYLTAAILLILTAWLVFMPVVKFALDNPDAFWYRTQQISIFTKRDQADLSKALWESTEKHLLMFNVEGDKNGRHNLPGAPMLDPIMGLLLILGLALALARPSHPANMFFLILLPIALIGGIFSVDFEAPQSLRSIAVMPAIFYFVTLPVVALGREAETVMQPLPKIWVLGPAVAAAAAIYLINAHTYLVRQANDFASWNAFSAPETITGRQMAALGPDYTYILSPFLTNHPTTQFLAPEITQQQHLSLPDALPVRDASDRPVAIFLHPDDIWVFNDAKKMYPNAKFETFFGPRVLPDSEEGPPSVYFVGLQPSDLMSVRGLDLRYWSTTADPETQFFTGPLASSRAYNINVTWPQDSPAERDFYAEWNGILYAPEYGPYTFHWVTPAGGLVEIDGTPVIEGTADTIKDLLLAEGNHQIRVRAEGGQGEVALYWQPPRQDEESLIPAWVLYTNPVTNHGLRGSFYPNLDWSGSPVLQRIDPFLDTYFHLIPLKRPYSVEWEGALVAPQSGLYRLGLRAVQEGELFIDSQSLLTTTGPDEYTEAPISLDAGLHSLLIRYRDTVDRSRIHLSWIPPNGSIQPIPTDYLWPPMGKYPEPSAPVADAVETQSIRLQHLVSLGMPGREAGQFLEPRDVAVLSDGRLVVADTGNRRVQIFDGQYNYLTTLTGDDDPFEEPLAVATTGDDNILVLDSTLQWIYRYDSQGNLIERFGGPQVRFFHPRGLTVFDDDSLAVADTGTGQIKFFDPSGGLTGSTGTVGTAPGQFNEPTDVIRDGQGTYFVAEAENDRIQRLDGAGLPLNQWTIPSSLALNGPHLALAPDNSIFVTQADSGTLQRYTPDGVLLDQWQTINEISFSAPVGLYFDAITRRLYVTDIATHQVHVFWVQVGDAEG
ncbi:MAG: glycosyltransferase family 39 protein [Anaerolineaceae bacterium]|nr:glycosyltransferase family 39 protein [Anaerolineaceae bacterium]MCB9097964.1 glycosyltransferase family 39 protein [Anaerolineales bacterium]